MSPGSPPLLSKKSVGMYRRDGWFTDCLLVLFYPVAEFGVALKLNFTHHHHLLMVSEYGHLLVLDWRFVSFVSHCVLHLCFLTAHVWPWRSLLQLNNSQRLRWDLWRVHIFCVFYRTATSQFQWMCKRRYFISSWECWDLTTWFQQWSSLHVDQSLNAASLPLESLVNKGKYTDQCPVGGHDCYSSLTMKNSDLQLSQIAPQHIISSSQRPYTWWR